MCLTIIKFNENRKILHTLYTIMHGIFVFYFLLLYREIGTLHRAGEKAELDLTWKC